MKILIFLTLTIFLSNCQFTDESKNTETADSTGNYALANNKAEIPIIEIATKSDSLLNQIQGIWGNETSENAIFKIKKDSICYLDGETVCYKFKLEATYITVYYDGFDEKFTIKYDRNKELLYLNQTDKSNVYSRFKH